MTRLLPCLPLAVVLSSALFSCARPSRDEPHERAPAVGYGTVMAEVGRRFELLGRAAEAGRHELVEYELGEIEEVFSEALPQAEPPREGHPELLPGLAITFEKEVIPDLRRAVSGRKRAEVIAAFSRAAAACNACHQASGHGFIEVPAVPGRSVPSTDP